MKCSVNPLRQNRHSLPIEIQLALRGSTVAQIQVDKALVGNAHILGDSLKVCDGRFIKPDGNLLFELGRIGVFPGGGEVVFFAHVTPLWVRFGFPGNCLARGDNANDIAFAPVTVTDKQQSQRAAEAQQNKTVFVLGVIGIVDQLRALIDKNGLGFLEAHTVLLEICGSLSIVPLESMRVHTYSITTL